MTAPPFAFTGRRSEVQVALVEPLGRHVGRVLCVARSVEAASLARFAPGHWAAPGGHALVLVGVAVLVGTVVSLSGAVFLRAAGRPA